MYRYISKTPYYECVLSRPRNHVFLHLLSQSLLLWYCILSCIYIYSLHYQTQTPVPPSPSQLLAVTSPYLCLPFCSTYIEQDLDTCLSGSAFSCAIQCPPIPCILPQVTISFFMAEQYPFVRVMSHSVSTNVQVDT